MFRKASPRSRVLLGLVLVLTMMVIAGCGTDLQPTRPTGIQQTVASANVGYDGSRPEYAAGEVIVKFTAGASVADRSAALNAVGGTVGSRILTQAMKSSGDTEGLTVVRTPMAVLSAVSALRSRPGVEYAEPNCYFYPDAVSNDPYYIDGTLWGMYGDATTPANQYGIQAGEAWAAGNTGSTSVLVGEIDGDIMFTHPDLDGQIWTNPYDPVDGIDNDDNGYIDDIHGWDFVFNDNTIYDSRRGGHGTHVAGTIGARGGNGIGVAGVCWNIQIISGKIFGVDGPDGISATATDVVLAIDYFTDLKLRHGLNIVATNNSYGGAIPDVLVLQSLQDAIERSNQANIVFVAGAGNAGTNADVTAFYPASCPNANIIAVAAIDSTGALASWSNYGLTTVDLGAPGVAIISTIPGGQGTGSYGPMDGTSTACPHVTGGVALYAATHPGASVATIKAAVLGSTVPTASLAGKCVTGGRLNVSGF